jgi:DNA-binding transcriptional LysR family regulator
MSLVVSPQHPLAVRGALIPTTVLAEYLQLVHTDRPDLPPGREFAHLSPRTWLLAHLGAKLAFLRAGFGFGFMPLHVVEADLASGELVQISAEDTPPEGEFIAMSAIYRTDSPPGPAGRWFIDHLNQEDAQPLKPEASQPAVAIAEGAPRNTPLLPRHRVLNGRSQEMRNGC